MCMRLQGSPFCMLSHVEMPLLTSLLAIWHTLADWMQQSASAPSSQVHRHSKPFVYHGSAPAAVEGFMHDSRLLVRWVLAMVHDQTDCVGCRVVIVAMCPIPAQLSDRFLWNE